MKQNLKSELSRERILNAASAEFGTKGYAAASLNTICTEHGISKGLIYHNFKNKDALYLACVAKCFAVFTEFLQAAHYDAGHGNIQMLFDLRNDFFRQNPFYSKLFFDATLQPPKHLLAEIKRCRAVFDTFNLEQYKAAIHTLTLRDGITEEDAVAYFCMLVDFFNSSFQNKAPVDFNSLMEEHETKLSKTFAIMLYGIAIPDTKGGHLL
ncbi:MAG: TetR/AcrR family transcriptional regulator [Oscillospiraceae bacterium]